MIIVGVILFALTMLFAPICNLLLSCCKLEFLNSGTLPLLYMFSRFVFKIEINDRIRKRYIKMKTDFSFTITYA